MKAVSHVLTYFIVLFKNKLEYIPGGRTIKPMYYTDTSIHIGKTWTKVEWRCGQTVGFSSRTRRKSPEKQCLADKTIIVFGIAFISRNVHIYLFPFSERLTV